MHRTPILHIHSGEPGSTTNTPPLTCRFRHRRFPSRGKFPHHHGRLPTQTSSKILGPPSASRLWPASYAHPYVLHGLQELHRRSYPDKSDKRSGLQNACKLLCSYFPISVKSLPHAQRTDQPTIIHVMLGRLVTLRAKAKRFVSHLVPVHFPCDLRRHAGGSLYLSA